MHSRYYLTRRRVYIAAATRWMLSEGAVARKGAVRGSIRVGRGMLRRRDVIVEECTSQRIVGENFLTSCGSVMRLDPVVVDPTATEFISANDRSGKVACSCGCSVEKHLVFCQVDV